MIKFSILIPIHNRLNITKQGLQALYQALDCYKTAGKAACRFDVVVIDDGSTDGSSQWIAENYPDVYIVTGDGNLWWSGGINKGAGFSIDQLDTDYLLLWNDDISPETSYFVSVESAFTSHDFSNTVLGSKILTKGTKKIWSVGGHFNKIWGKYGMYDDPGTTQEFFECDWLPGMGTFVPVLVLKTHGLHWDDRRFPQYHGDSDFTLRCKEKGFKIKTCLNFIIYNGSEAPAGSRKNDFKSLWTGLNSMRSIYHFRTRLLFYRQHGIWPLYCLKMAGVYFQYFGSFFKKRIGF